MYPPIYDGMYAQIAQSRFGRGFMASHSAALIQEAKSTLMEMLAERGATGLRVLEIGCNTGGFLSEFQRVYGFKCLGLDLNGMALCAARGRGDDVLHGDVKRLPVANRSIDVIFSQHTLEHVPDLPEALRECERALQVGGKAFVIVPLNWWGLETIRVAREGLPPSRRSWREAWSQARQLHCSPLGGPLGGARRHVRQLLQRHKINLAVVGGVRWNLFANLLIFGVRSGSDG